MVVAPQALLRGLRTQKAADDNAAHALVDKAVAEANWVARDEAAGVVCLCPALHVDHPLTPCSPGIDHFTYVFENYAR